MQLLFYMWKNTPGCKSISGKELQHYNSNSWNHKKNTTCTNNPIKIENRIQTNELKYFVITQKHKQKQIKYINQLNQQPKYIMRISKFMPWINKQILAEQMLLKGEADIVVQINW